MEFNSKLRSKLKKYFGKLETNAIGNTYEVPASALEESINSTDEFKVTVTFVPADGEEIGIQPRDATHEIFVGQPFKMQGTHHLLLYGMNAIELKGNLAIGKNVGTAQVKAFKSDGSVLGVFTFVVIR